MTELEINLNKILQEKNEKIIPENLRKGVTCLGIEGTLIPNTNDATATENDILEGKTAYAKEELITGIIPDNGELVYTPSEEEQTIPEGYASKITVNSIDIEQLDSYKNSLDKAKQILPGLALRPYIKYNDATAYTDLGIIPNNKYKYEIHFDDSIGQKGNDITLFGYYNNNNRFLFGISDPYRVAGSVWVNTAQAYKPCQHILVMSNELGYVLDNEKIYTLDIPQDGVTLRLNKTNQSSHRGFNGKIFEFIVYDENEEIIFDAIPDESGTFKDKISNTVLTTSGAVEFGYDNWKI